jgi:flagellar basal-body rod protein FlgB
MAFRHGGMRNMADISTLQMLQGYLKLTNQRQQLIVSNMANVDTPGYHTKDLDFQGALQKAMYSDGDIRMEPTAVEVTQLPERPDGNNVNIDRESMMLSQTQLQYQIGVQLVKSEFHTLFSAIKEGS